MTAEIPIPENQTEPVVLLQESFAVSVQELNPDDFEMQTFSVSLGDNPFSGGDMLLNNNSLSFSLVNSPTANLTLQQNLFDSLPVSNSSRITLSVFLTDELYLRRNDSALKVGSIIMEASVVGSTIESLTPLISLRFLINSVSNQENIIKYACINH